MSTDGRSRGRGLIAVAATTAGVLIVFGFDLLPYRVRGAADGAISLALQLYAAVLSRRIAALPTTTRSARRFWRIVAASAVCFGGGTTIYLVLAVLDPDTVGRTEPP